MASADTEDLLRTNHLFRLLIALSTVSMAAFMTLFLLRNAPGFAAPGAITAVATLYALAYLFATARLLQALAKSSMPYTARSKWTLLPVLLCCLGLVYLFLNSTVFDYYQPLSLYDDAIGALALWWGSLIVACLLLAGFGATNDRLLLQLLLLALITWPAANALDFINRPSPGNSVAGNSHVFVGGENGYDTYRIPGLVVIPAHSRLTSGETSGQDRLLAFAEARRDGALDTGVIDLALRISEDDGASWNKQAILCQHHVANRRGKCGNPTPVFDRTTGKVILAYNLSGTGDNGRWHSGHTIESGDGGLSWSKPQEITADDFVFGPGKGLQKTRAPFRNRLLLPGYAGIDAYVLHSDDGGANWLRSDAVVGANESDVAELSNGELYMATRHAAPIGRAPLPNGRLFSVSDDGGNTWSATRLDTALPTPVCQASVSGNGTGQLLFSNPRHERSRVNLTLMASNDAGASWPLARTVYPGPSGYSVLGRGSDGRVHILYENGNMAYSERISLASIAATTVQESRHE